MRGSGAGSVGGGFVHDFFPTARCGWSSSFAGDYARLSSRPAAAQQGPAVPCGPADRGGDRRGHAPRRRSAVRPADASAGRAALALGATDHGGAQPGRKRSRSRPSSVLVRCGKGGKRREVGMDRWAWQHLEAWIEIRVTLRVGALLCVIDGPTKADRGRQPRHEPRSGSSPSRPGFAVGSPRTSSDTRTPSRWPAKAFP
jgi:hypothetical protein